ncbi:hypothetical protein AB3329_01915 [Streptococcus sp. H31]|uniref:hypothetical protein n=1 Tax=Streptococcus huangxiaojuni TaxID=3237239 RepID=UPI0034A24F98
MRKKIVVTLLLLVLGIGFMALRSCSKQKTRLRNDSSVSEKSSVISSNSDEQSFFSARDEAEETLERNDSLLGDKETAAVAASLHTAFDYLRTVKKQSEVAVTYQDKLAITKRSMAQTVVAMFLAGYTVDWDTVMVYASDNDNVYQFTVDLVKSGSDNLSLVGNYVTGTEQLEITSLHGIPTGIQY